MTTTASGVGQSGWVVYGDFNCPWSYLASRRTARLAADGVDVEWRMVEHAARPRRVTAVPAAPASSRSGPLLPEMPDVLSMLLPGEELPYALAGFLPDTGAAVTGYAEAYLAGVATPVRELLFDALWLHALDLDDPAVVHTLVLDAVRSGAAATAPLPSWEYAAGTGAGLLVDTWARDWREHGDRTVPLLLVGGEWVRGVAAVRWLGDELVARGLVPGTPARSVRAAPPPT